MRNSATARIVVMGGLAIVLMVPLMLVQNTVAERSSRRDAAVADVSATWGGPQVVGGPVLAVPYVAAPTDTSGRVQRATFHAFVLPRNVQFEGRLATERRNRGIFDVPVYRAVLKVTGTFIRPDLEWIRPVPERIAWDEASLQVGIADPRGIVRRSSVAWRGGTQPLNGGGVDTGLFRSGLHAALPQLDTAPVHAELPFELTLEFNGTRSLHLLPAADETSVSLTSPWPHPAFSGAPLPESRRVDASGFTSQWRVQDFGRPYASRWTSYQMNQQQMAVQATQSSFGVNLIQPVDIYQQAERAVKYALLFVVLTFLVFFLWEIFGATLLHPVQYTFVGIAMCVFYLLLVSLSEHTEFNFAYAVSSIVTTVLIAGYARAVFGGLRQGASVAAALSGLYGFLYLLLRLEDYSLLAGSVGLFVVLALVMFLTRRMNWYQLKLGER